MTDQGLSDEAGYVLIVEDDASIASLIEEVLQQEGMRTQAVPTAPLALTAVEREVPDIVLLDLGLPGVYGTSLAVTLRRKFPKLPFIVISALPKHAVAQDAWSIGAAAYLTKPFDCDDLVTMVKHALAKPQRIPVRRETDSVR